jgi:hypothetical protein
MEVLHTGANKFKLQDNARFRLILVLSCIVLIIVREPALLLFPRIWAEEGTVFYEFALHHSVWDIFTTAHVGYLTLFNSVVSALQAKVFSIDMAAAVSTYISFLTQLIPVYILTCTSNNLWNSPVKKISCSLIVVLVIPPEMWLNTTNSHFIFGLITFLILVVEASSLKRIQKYFFRLLLLMGGLTGPASIFFTPVFLVKAYRDKHKEKYIQAIIISICALIQALVIVYSLFYNNRYQRLSTHTYSRTVYHFFVDNFSMLSQAFTSYFHTALMFYLSLAFAVLMAGLYCYLLIKNRKNDYLIPLLSILFVAFFSTLGSLHMAGGPRYAYIPTCILMFVLLSEVTTKKKSSNKIRNFAFIALCLCLSGYIISYRCGMNSVYSSAFPKWKDELEKNRMDSTYMPLIHPGTEAWRIRL